MPNETHQDWRQAVAGCTAGVASVLALQPLDVVKTRLQVQDGLQSSIPSYRGTFDALRSMVRQEGWRVLYAGLLPALLGSSVSWSLYFYSYSGAKSRYKQWLGVRELAPQYNLLSAVEAGVLVCLVTNPLWVIKTRLQLQQQQALRARQPLPMQGPGPPTGPLKAPPPSAVNPGPLQRVNQGLSWRPAGWVRLSGAAKGMRGSPRPYAGFTDAVVNIAREEGLAGFYKGLGPSLFLVSHGAIQFMVYEELKSLAANHYQLPGWFPGHLRGPQGAPERETRSISSTEITAMGAISKLAAALVTYPFQVVRARLQQRQDRSSALRYVTSGQVVRLTLRREGIGGLYKGLVPSMLRVMPQSAITLLVYESVMKQLNAPKKQQSA